MTCLRSDKVLSVLLGEYTLQEVLIQKKSLAVLCLAIIATKNVDYVLCEGGVAVTSILEYAMSYNNIQ